MQALNGRLDHHSSKVLGVFRIVVGFLYAIHGTVHLFAWPMAQGGGATPFGKWPFWWAGLVELVASLALVPSRFGEVIAAELH